MMTRSVSKLSISALLALCTLSTGLAQVERITEKTDPAQRVNTAPESVFKMFREAGMQPVDFALTPAHRNSVQRAFALLPPLHRRILQKHLHSISFMDNMPNTALTSILDTVDGQKMFNITFRAGLLEQSISEWATWKENTCFNSSDTPGYQLRVEAGDMDALVYVLLHEATHVLDAVVYITPSSAENDSVPVPTRFTSGIWRTTNRPEGQYVDTLLEQTRFRSGKPQPIRTAPDVYNRLAKTPFPSLYGMAACSEDLAELTTIHHLTTRLNQPFRVVVTKDNIEMASFEPIKNALVRRRLGQLTSFYAE